MKAINSMQKQQLSGQVDRWAKAKNEIADAWYSNQFSKSVLEKWDIDLPINEKDKLKKQYIIPLFELLLEYIKTGDRQYLYLYLDERLRFAPHRLPKEERKKFFEQVIYQDINTLIELSDSDDELLRQELQTMHSSLIETSSDTVSILALGDCLMNEIRVFLPHLFQAETFDVDLRCIYFSAVMNKGISHDEVKSYLEKFDIDMLAISFFSFEGIGPYKILLKEIEQLDFREILKRVDQLVLLASRFLSEIRELTEVPILLHNVSGLPLNRFRRRLSMLPVFSTNQSIMLEYLNHEIESLCHTFTNCILLDEMHVAEKYGHRQSSQSLSINNHDKVALYHTSLFGNYIGEAYKPYVYCAQKYKKIKVICVDFDNTLWDGVMADGEVSHYKDRQSLLKQLKDQGLILVAVSKNTESNIRWDEMTLQQDDFALCKISWNQKISSIRQAAHELNLGINSFFFLDDNPAELDLVRSEEAQVTCLDATDPHVWWELDLLFKLPVTKDTEESRNRTSMYQAQIQRSQSMNDEIDYPEMMRGLGLKASIFEAKNENLERISELVARTNQFNTTTKRYKKSELEEFISSDSHTIYVADFSDKFGKLGIVAVVILKHTENEVVIDSFIMSCRAMGFSLEQKLLHHIVNNYSNRVFVGQYIETDRNSPCAQLFQKAGFEKISDTEWALTPEYVGNVDDVDWITS